MRRDGREMDESVGEGGAFRSSMAPLEVGRCMLVVVE
jgi:hypothetical protein